MGMSVGTSANSALVYKLKTVKRYNAAILAVDFSAKVEASDSSVKWL